MKKTIAISRTTKDEQRIGALLYPERSYWRPSRRGECESTARPCPYVSCRHHLFMEVDERTGSIKINRPGLEVWELDKSCSLDGADRGGITLDEVGHMLGMTRERARQVEEQAKHHMAQKIPGGLESLLPVASEAAGASKGGRHRWVEAAMETKADV